MWMSYDEIIGLIRGAGKEPAGRDSLYQTVRTFEDWTPRQAVAHPEGPAGPTFKIEHRPQAGVRKPSLPVVSGVDSAEERMRLGRIGYINCYPVYAGLDPGVVRVPAALV